MSTSLNERAFPTRNSLSSNNSRRSSSESDHDLDDDDDDDDDDDRDGNKVSILASYYGIEPERPEDGGTIDEAGFNSDSYVKDILQNDSVERLLVKDSELIHEIRTLDGEMQKLVYDNYNKFITATETIKEMKNGVFGMDEDMESVRVKMKNITQTSKELDDVFQVKRMQVDKLVRIRRLLTRLEFLSELPERLSEMIDKKNYQEAVQLYRKTISVLTKHSHVLSFKNIKERTEIMMKDLTDKVINLLDDRSLEAVKLTQYVSVLVMMSAPRGKVLERLLHSHKMRSLNMIQAFMTKTSTLSANVDRADGKVADVSHVREFHQSLVVGLIEACKGVQELFAPSSVNEIAAPADAAEAFAELKAMNSAVMAEYSKTMLSSLRKFLNEFSECFTSETLDYTAGSDYATLFHQTSNESEENSRFEKLSEMFEERNKWMLLARQILVDVNYLDQSEMDCQQRVVHPNLTPANIGKSSGKKNRGTDSTSHGVEVGELILKELQKHCDVILRHRVKSFVSTVLMEHSKVIRLCEFDIICASGTGLSSDYSNSDSIPSSDSMGYTRNAGQPNPLHHQVSVVRKVLRSLSDNAIQLFNDVSKDLKPVIDILDVSLRDSEPMVAALASKYCNLLAHEIEGVCAIYNHRCRYDPNTDTLTYSDESMLKLQIAAKLKGRHADGNAEDYAEEDNIYSEAAIVPDDDDDEDDKYDEADLVHLNSEEAIEYSHTSDNLTESNTESSPLLSIQRPQLLVFYQLLHELLKSNSIWNSINSALYNLDIPNLEEGHEDLQQLCLCRLSLTCEILMHAFIESNAAYSAQRLSTATYASYRAAHYNTGSSSYDSVSSTCEVSDQVVRVGQFLESLTVTCSIVLGEQLSKKKDIDRLFARKVMVFDHPSQLSGLRFGAGEVDGGLCLETAVNVIIKASLKSVVESVRMWILSYDTYVQLQMDVTFIKQISAFLLKDCSQNESLADQSLRAAFARFSGANDIASASDSRELSAVARAVSEGLHKLAPRSFLIPNK